jgi:hypothetical protein
VSLLKLEAGEGGDGRQEIGCRRQEAGDEENGGGSGSTHVALLPASYLLIT